MARVLGIEIMRLFYDRNTVDPHYLQILFLQICLMANIYL